jgi:hypothetical protein
VQEELMFLLCPGPNAPGLDLLSWQFGGASFHFIIWQLEAAKLKDIFKLPVGLIVCM